MAVNNSIRKTLISYHIRCDGKHKEVKDDFHPLTRHQVNVMLLDVANDIGCANSVQIRLCQGIKGAKCPHPLDKEYYDRQSAIVDPYLEWVRKGEKIHQVAKLLEVLWNILSKLNE